MTPSKTIASSGDVVKRVSGGDQKPEPSLPLTTGVSKVESLRSPKREVKSVTPPKRISESPTFLVTGATQKGVPSKRIAQQQKVGVTSQNRVVQDRVVEYVKKQMRAPLWRGADSLPKSSSIQAPVLRSKAKRSRSVVSSEEILEDGSFLLEVIMSQIDLERICVDNTLDINEVFSQQ